MQTSVDRKKSGARGELALVMANKLEVLWSMIREEASTAARVEPMLADYLREHILAHAHFEDAVSHMLAGKLASSHMGQTTLTELIAQALKDDVSIANAMLADVEAIYSRDPACDRLSLPILFYKGFHAISCYRIAHWLWKNDRRLAAMYVQSRVSELFAVDIHPAARIGQGIFLDHAHGFVVGETAVVEDNVSILHGVTLGGTGKHSGHRHPTIRSGVLIGAGAKILGNIEVGTGAKIGAGSVVIESIEPNVTAVGVPARTVRLPADEEPALSMNHQIPPALG